jgi:ribosomal-protein-alanine N-acetyltransferase
MANIPYVIDSATLTHDVILRLVKKGDGAALADAVVRNRTHLTPTDPYRADEYFTAEWQEAEVARQLDAFESGSTLPLVLAREEQIVGRLTLSSIVRGPLQSAALGYWIDSELTGKGIMSSAVSNVIRIARDDLGLHRLEAGTLVHNVASQKVLQRAGFEYFGTAKKFLKIAGSWQDHKLFQVLLHD